jgi:Uma2 family endonuclease
MGHPARARPTADELRAALDALATGQKGEIVDGELHVQPRPRAAHAHAGFSLGRRLARFYEDGDDGGTGGWILLVEPGIELPDAAEIAPDLAGWRRERLAWDGDAPIRVVPDWVCEVLSPSNALYDRRVKFPFYARVGVAWLWVVDPRDRTVEIRRLDAGLWTIVATFADTEPLRAPPFEEVEIPLDRLWAPAPRPPSP